jgi:hypothetical protein
MPCGRGKEETKGSGYRGKGPVGIPPVLSTEFKFRKEVISDLKRENQLLSKEVMGESI